MDLYLMVLIISSILLIIFLIWISKVYFTINDDKEIILDDEIDMVAEPVLKIHIKQLFNVDLTDQQIASNLLEKLYNILIPHNNLVIGKNIDKQYKAITGKNILNIAYGTEYADNYIDKLFNLRDVSGKDCQIAIIHDKTLRNKLLYSNNYDLNELKSFLDSGIEDTTRNFITEVLNNRWSLINEINTPNIINSNGSFLYLNNIENLNIKALKTPEGFRVNLLCRELEFQALIKRLKSESQPLLAYL